MRLIRESSSPRLRAGLRAVLPALVTLLLLLLARVALVAAFGTSDGGRPLGEAVLLRGLLALVYVGMLGVALWSASTLDHRAYQAFGLHVNREWVRNFAAGTVLGLSGYVLALWWGLYRGSRSLDLSADVTGPGGPVLLGVAVGSFVLYFLLGNVYEEVIYRGVMLQNFAEGLSARGLSSTWSVGFATVASLTLFGLYHVPLRGNLVVAVDAALVGITMALAYVLTGELGLALGVHFARIPFELLTGWEYLGFELPAIVRLTRDSLSANLEVKVVHLGLVCLFVLAWVYLMDGELRVAENVYR